MHVYSYTITHTRVAGAKRSYRTVVSDKIAVASELKKATRQVNRLATMVDAAANKSESLRESRRERNEAERKAKEAIAERDRLLAKYMARTHVCGVCGVCCVCCVCLVCAVINIVVCVFVWCMCLPGLQVQKGRTGKSSPTRRKWRRN